MHVLFTPSFQVDKLDGDKDGKVNQKEWLEMYEQTAQVSVIYN